MKTHRDRNDRTGWLRLLHLCLLPCLSGLFTAAVASDQPWHFEPAREFEELRLRQLQTVQQTAPVSAFTTDGCSGGQSQSWEILAQTLPGFEQHFGDKPLWESCCVTHDRAYWQGPAHDGYARRKVADLELKRCVLDVGAGMTAALSTEYSVPAEKVQRAFATTAELMYRAVRIGGQPCSLLPWRWGYGWDNCAFASISAIPESVSNIKADEQVRFFNTTAWLDADGAFWHIPVHAWIYEPQASQVRKSAFASILQSNYDFVITPENEAVFSRRVNLLIADNERGKNLVLRLAGRDIQLPESSADGHAFSVLKLPVEVVDAFANKGLLGFHAVLENADRRRFEGQVQLLPRHGLGVISDIDDTVKVSEVTDIRRLIDNTFFRDFRGVPGMADLYQHLSDQGASLHFVSSSPWQLYDPLQGFLRDADFPRASLSLKTVRFRDETLFNLFKPGTETKPAQIEPILQQYPHRKFILVGDSGEQDPEVYGDIARRYPGRIHRILIRNVDDSQFDDPRYQQAFTEIAARRWQLFDDPMQISVEELLRR